MQKNLVTYYTSNEKCIDIFLSGQINKFWHKLQRKRERERINNKIYSTKQNPHPILLLPVSFRLCLIITTGPAAETTSAGPVGHLDVRSRNVSSIFFSRATRTGRCSGPSRCFTHAVRRLVCWLRNWTRLASL